MVASDQVLATGAQLDTLSINTIRTLAIDAVQQANSGHPGAPMALAPVAYCLWQRFLRYDPIRSNLAQSRPVRSVERPRVDVVVRDVASRRGAPGRRARERNKGTGSVDGRHQTLPPVGQPHARPSRIAHHIRESKLRQGLSVKELVTALVWRWRASGRRRISIVLSLEIFDFNVYAMCSDGDLMEGIGGEAASLAGHLKLSNLCWMYDNNKITLDGPANWSFSEDVATRFIGYGWNVTRVSDANDLEMLARAFGIFQKTTDRPTLIIIDSHIGYGSPHKQDSNASHGEPLGEEEVKLVKKFYGWPEDAKFLIPDGVRESFRDGVGKRGREASRTVVETLRGILEEHIPTWQSG